jgi:hypothetical protein
MNKIGTFGEKVVPWIALAVSVASAVFTYIQTAAIKSQVVLQELQVRPYVKYIPSFSTSKREIEVELFLANLSPVPAYVPYTGFAAWIDGTPSSMTPHSAGSEILFQGKDGMSTLPTIKGDLAKRLIAGKSTLEVGVCVVYGPSSKTDVRRWELVAFYRYDPGTSLPTTYLLDESVVPATKETCDANAIRELWLTSPARQRCKDEGPYSTPNTAPAQ